MATAHEHLVGAQQLLKSGEFKDSADDISFAIRALAHAQIATAMILTTAPAPLHTETYDLED